jgi:hypothetical protein
MFQFESELMKLVFGANLMNFFCVNNFGQISLEEVGYLLLEMLVRFPIGRLPVVFVILEKLLFYSGERTGDRLPS